MVLVSNLTSPTSLLRDETTGDLFVTEISQAGLPEYTFPEIATLTGLHLTAQGCRTRLPWVEQQ